MNSNNPIFAILEKIPLFEDLTEESSNIISSKITLEYYPKNHLIFSEGDEGDAMYIIKNGSVKIFRGPAEDPDEQEEVAVLNNNAFFGEMALVSDKPRNASAKTIDDSEIFRLKKDDFYNLVTNNPSLAEQISSEFISRVKENMRKRSTS